MYPQLLHCPAKLGGCAGGLVLRAVLEHRVAVGVEGEGDAPTLKQPEIAEAVLLFTKQGVDHSAGGIVHRDEQRELRATLAQPAMVVAVRLDQHTLLGHPPAADTVLWWASSPGTTQSYTDQHAPGVPWTQSHQPSCLIQSHMLRQQAVQNLESHLFFGGQSHILHGVNVTFLLVSYLGRFCCTSTPGACMSAWPSDQQLPFHRGSHRPAPAGGNSCGTPLGRWSVGSVPLSIVLWAAWEEILGVGFMGIYEEIKRIFRSDSPMRMAKGDRELAEGYKRRIDELEKELEQRP